MCGRIKLTSSAEIVAEVFGLAAVAPLAPRYNIAPTQPVAVVRVEQPSGPRRLVETRWGLIPYGAQDPAIGNRLINARAESLSERPAFRWSFSKRRCLVVVDGFYEWQRGRGKSQPYVLRLHGGSPFALAGIWDIWRDPHGGKVETCAIITTVADRVVEPIHDRMPVIVDSEGFDLWLDPAVTGAAALAPLLQPRRDTGLEATAVSTHVNDPRNDDAHCIEPELLLL